MAFEFPLVGFNELTVFNLIVREFGNGPFGRSGGNGTDIMGSGGGGGGGGAPAQGGVTTILVSSVFLLSSSTENIRTIIIII